jgi:hypothetical protein
MLNDRGKEPGADRLALLLISDCEDRASRYTQKELFEKLAGTGIQIFVVALTEDLGKDPGFTSASPKNRSETFAAELALRTGGAVFTPALKKLNKEAIDEILKPVIEEMRTPYVIGYTSTNKNRDDRKRKLRVEIAAGEKGEVRTGFVRESFVIPKDQK